MHVKRRHSFFLPPDGVSQRSPKPHTTNRRNRTGPLFLSLNARPMQNQTQYIIPRTFFCFVRRSRSHCRENWGKGKKKKRDLTAGLRRGTPGLGLRAGTRQCSPWGQIPPRAPRLTAPRRSSCAVLGCRGGRKRRAPTRGQWLWPC